MPKTFPTLYSRTSTGAVQQWTIIAEVDSFYAISGQVGGKLTTSDPNKCVPKNEGKANATTAEQQAETEALAKWKKKIKENYFENIDDIDGGWLEPQLCEPGKKFWAKVEYPVIVDEKLNGICCLVTKKGPKSRKNEDFHTIPHIVEDLAKIIQDNPEIYLHGELFNKQHVNELNRIAALVSVCRKPKDITPGVLSDSRDVVQYHVYDGYGFTEGGVFWGAGTPFKERRAALYRLLADCKYFRPVNFKECHNYDEVVEFAEAYIARKGEGAVVKNPKAGYVHKRTKNCLKYKKLIDEEFEVDHLLEGSGNWAGMVKMAVCKLNKPSTKGETTFKSNVDGTQEHLQDLWNRREEWNGKKRKVTVRFQEYSPYGVPLTPYTDLVERNYE